MVVLIYLIVVIVIFQPTNKTTSTSTCQLSSSEHADLPWFSPRVKCKNKVNNYTPGYMHLSFDFATPNLPTPDERTKLSQLAIASCEHGRNLLEAREYAQAKSAYQVAIECDPKLAIAHSGLARVNYHLREDLAALVAINIAIESDDARTDFYHQRALADFDRAIALKPQEALFHHARGRTYQQLGNFPAALADLDLFSSG